MDSWERLEKDRARKTNGKRTPGSGNKWLKGDVHNPIFIEELKSSQQVGAGGPYIDLQVEWFIKLCKYVSGYGLGAKQPLIGIAIGPLHVYCFIRYDYWLGCEGALPNAITERECLGRQVRLYADESLAYTVFDLGKVGKWICLPESDQLLLMKIVIDLEEKCQIQNERKPKPAPSQRQLERAEQIKERAKEIRKRRYQEYKNQKYK